MCETQPLFTATFNRSVQIESRPEHLTGEAGALIQREIMDRLGIIDWLDAHLHDARDASRVTYPLADLLRTHLLLLGQGWCDQDDADRLRHDPSLRVAQSSCRGQTPLDDGHTLASQPTLSRLVENLSSDDNRAVLRQAITETAIRRLRMSNGRRKRKTLTIDVDSLPVTVHGHQAGSEWNKYYGRRIYHPLVASCAETGDLLDAVLRPGNVGTAAGGLDFILEQVDRCRKQLAQRVMVRFDAGFPDGITLAGLEARKVDYMARIRNNAVLDAMAQPHLKRPPGRPPETPRVWCHEYRYQAQSWGRARRVVLVVLEQPGDLFLHHFWLITNLAPGRCDGKQLLARYRQRGKAEAHMGELMDVLNPALSASPRPWHDADTFQPALTAAGVYRNNETLFLLHLLAYELLHTGRAIMACATGQGWSLRRFRERVLRVAARVVKKGRRLTFVIAWSAANDWYQFWHQLQRYRWAPA
ncbi:MAG: hypothetical protein Tsb0027_02490 [Wenzhouxiangellaceae bacterium]